MTGPGGVTFSRPVEKVSGGVERGGFAFSLWSKDVIFGTSHVAGGKIGKPWGKLGFVRGEKVRGDHGIVTRPNRSSGEDIPELDSLGSPSGLQPRYTRLIPVCVVIYPAWKRESSWSPLRAGVVMDKGKVIPEQKGPSRGGEGPPKFWGEVWGPCREGIDTPPQDKHALDWPRNSPVVTGGIRGLSCRGETDRGVPSRFGRRALGPGDSVFGLDPGLARLQARLGGIKATQAVFGLNCPFVVMPDLNCFQLRADPRRGGRPGHRLRIYGILDPAQGWLRRSEDRGAFFQRGSRAGSTLVLLKIKYGGGGPLRRGDGDRWRTGTWGPGGTHRAVRAGLRQRTHAGRVGGRRVWPGPGDAERAGTARNTPAGLAGADPRGKGRNGAALRPGPGGMDGASRVNCVVTFMRTTILRSIKVGGEVSCTNNFKYFYPGGGERKSHRNGGQ